MRFAKYQGIGNDFIMIADAEDRISLMPDQVRRLCDRRFGIGADGVIRVAPGRDGADFFMDYANSDGSPGEMCGNGIRCLALFVRDEGLSEAAGLKVATRAGVKILNVDGPRVTVDMGPPIFHPDAIPVRWEGDDALHAKVDLDSEVLEATCLSMGNPHAVIFVDEPDSVAVPEIGRAIEHHSMFPNLTNVEFAKVEAPELVRMRVWERGSGETLACGTGAAAVAVASQLVGGASQRLTVVLPGGELEIEWTGSLDDERSVLMTGPALKTFEGDVDLETLV